MLKRGEIISPEIVFTLSQRGVGITRGKDENAAAFNYGPRRRKNIQVARSGKSSKERGVSTGGNERSTLYKHGKLGKG